METLVRKNVFETNSSSTHSLTVANKPDYSTLFPNKNGELRFANPPGFGWSWDTYDDPTSKAWYLYLYLRDWENGGANCPYDKYDKTKDARSQFTDVALEKLELLEKVIKDQTGADSIIWDDKADEKHYTSLEGYIDHQSVEYGLDGDVEFTEQSLKDFVFGIGSIIETGNDNE